MIGIDKKLMCTLIGIVFIAVACADAEFSGDGDKRGAEQLGNSQTPSNGGNQQGDPGGNGANNPNGTPIYAPGGNNGGSITDPGGNGFNFSNWFGWAGNGLDIEFGKPLSVWHIGDNNYSATNCKMRITGNRIDGRQFNFNFYVEQNNTQVGISVDHCGVDPGFQNTATLIGPQGNLGTLNLEVSDNLLFLKKQNWTSPVTLNQGWHKLRIISSLKQSNNDYDDFVVGKVRLIAPTGPIRLGEVTEN